MKNFLYWAPRILGILTILFVSLFALDVFQAGMPIFQMLLGFGIHLVPSFILVLCLCLAWKYEFWGGILFLAISLLPFTLLYNIFGINVILAVSFFLTGILFILNLRYKNLSKT